MAEAKAVRVSMKVERSAEEVRVDLGPPRVGCIMVFLAVWLTGWTFGGISAIRALFTTGFSLPSIFLLVWIAGWLVAETVFGGIFLYMLAGSERLTWTATEFRQRFGVFNLGWTWTYSAELLSGLRARDERFSGDEAVSLTFEYGPKTVRLRSSLTGDQIDQVVAAVFESFPEYGRDAPVEENPGRWDEPEDS